MNEVGDTMQCGLVSQLLATRSRSNPRYNYDFSITWLMEKPSAARSRWPSATNNFNRRWYSAVPHNWHII